METISVTCLGLFKQSSQKSQTLSDSNMLFTVTQDLYPGIL